MSDRTRSPRLGVFDSGVGGLTVVAALRRRLPGVAITYLGDTARLPYGTKSPATVARYTQRNVGFLLERAVDAVVVACNSASASGLDALESPVPVWGVIQPGAAAAAAIGRDRVAVIATESTVRSGAYPRAIAALRPDLEVLTVACPLFVPLVEEGWTNDDIARAVAHRYLDPLIEQQIDTLVLGCTHYPLLRPMLGEVLGEGVTLVDSAAAVSEQVASELALEEPATQGDDGDAAASGELELLVTDDSPGFARLARVILGTETSLHCVDVPLQPRRLATSADPPL